MENEASKKGKIRTKIWIRMSNLTRSG